MSHPLTPPPTRRLFSPAAAAASAGPPPSDPVNRRRNARSIVPDNIDLKLYEFIDSGDNLYQTLHLYSKLHHFETWHRDDPQLKQALQNRFKYLRGLHKFKRREFMEGFAACKLLVAQIPSFQHQRSAAEDQPPATPQQHVAFVEEDPVPAAAPTAGAEGGDAVELAAAAQGLVDMSSNPIVSPYAPPAAESPKANPPPLRETMSINPNRRTVLDLDRPEMNPKGMLVFRNRNYQHNGLQCDKLAVFVLLYDPRDYVHTRASMRPDGQGIMLGEPRVACFVRTNQADMHAAAEDDEVDLNSHSDAMRRMIRNREAVRETEYFFPPGVTCRTSPFSPHPVHIHKVFCESDMDFGEVDEHDLPVLHQKHWAKFVFAVNRATDTEDEINAGDIDTITNRFGNIGM